MIDRFQPKTKSKIKTFLSLLWEMLKMNLCTQITVRSQFDLIYKLTESLKQISTKSHIDTKHVYRTIVRTHGCKCARVQKNTYRLLAQNKKIIKYSY